MPPAGSMMSVSESPVIVSTRDEDARGPFARAVSAAGAALWTLPVTEAVAGPDVEQCRRLLARAKEFDWVVFTSQRAVDAVAKLPEAISLDGRHRRRPRIAV